MKKVLSLIVVLMTVFLLAVPTFAQDEATDTDVTSVGGESASLPSGNSLSPSVVVSWFSIGGDVVTAGNNFTLYYNLYNTNRNISVQNCTVKINGGDSFSLAKEADTQYIEKIKPRGAAELASNFTTSVETAPGSYPIAINVTYEYYDSGVKYTGAADLSISVPVRQEERVTIAKAAMGSDEEPVYVGEEYGVDYDFINSGFSKMLNTQMSLYDSENEVVSTAYLGTVNPSAQMTGSSYLYATFDSVGAKDMRLVITYEDQNSASHSVEREFTVNVEEIPAPIEEEEIQSENNFLLWAVVLIIIILAVVVLIILLRRRKKKKQNEEQLWDDDDLEDDDEETSEEEASEQETEAPEGDEDEDN